MLRFNVAAISAQVFNQNDRDRKQVLCTPPVKAVLLAKAEDCQS